MKGFGAAAPVAIALGASSAYASFIPSIEVPNVLKRDSSLPPVSVNGNGKMARNPHTDQRLLTRSKHSTLMANVSTSVALTTNQVRHSVSLIAVHVLIECYLGGSSDPTDPIADESVCTRDIAE